MMDENQDTNFNLSQFLEFKTSLHGLFMASGVVIWFATTLGFLGRYFWFFDLFSHFRVQYFVTSCLLGILFLVLRSQWIAAVSVIMAGINLVTFLPMYLGGQEPAPPTTDSICAMLINVNTRTGDPVRVKQFIEEIDPDILVLEEISNRWVDALTWIHEEYPYSKVRSREDNFGIGLYSKFPFDDCHLETIGPADVPSVVAVINSPQKIPLYLIATHPVPPANAQYSAWRNSQLHELAAYIDASVPTVLIGDLNVTPWNYYLKRLLTNGHLIDSARGHGISPSWPCQNPLLGIPLDHFLHSSSIKVVNRSIGTDVGSDHFPLIVDFIIEE